MLNSGLLPKVVTVRVHKAERLRIIPKSDRKSKKLTQKWKVKFLGGKKSMYTESIHAPAGNPVWDFEVTMKLSKGDPLVLLVTDSDDHHVGQVVISPQNILPRPTNPNERPTDPSRLQVSDLESTKKVETAIGTLYYWAWVEEYRNDDEPKKGFRGSLMNIRHSKKQSTISSALDLANNRGSLLSITPSEVDETDGKRKHRHNPFKRHKNDKYASSSSINIANAATPSHRPSGNFFDPLNPSKDDFRSSVFIGTAAADQSSTNSQSRTHSYVDLPAVTQSEKQHEQPVLTNLEPASCPVEGDSEVIVYGVGLTGDIMRNATVLVDGQSVSRQDWYVEKSISGESNKFELHIQMPPHPAGQCSIQLETTQFGSFRCPQQLTYVESAQSTNKSVVSNNMAIPPSKPPRLSVPEDKINKSIQRLQKVSKDVLRMTTVVAMRAEDTDDSSSDKPLTTFSGDEHDEVNYDSVLSPSPQAVTMHSKDVVRSESLESRSPSLPALSASSHANSLVIDDLDDLLLAQESPSKKNNFFSNLNIRQEYVPPSTDDSDKIVTGLDLDAGSAVPADDAVTIQVDTPPSAEDFVNTDTHGASSSSQDDEPAQSPTGKSDLGRPYSAVDSGISSILGDNSSQFFHPGSKRGVPATTTNGENSVQRSKEQQEALPENKSTSPEGVETERSKTPTQANTVAEFETDSSEDEQPGTEKESLISSRENYHKGSALGQKKVSLDDDSRFENEGLRAMLDEANRYIDRLKKQTVELEKVLSSKTAEVDRLSIELCTLRNNLLQDGETKYLEKYISTCWF